MGGSSKTAPLTRKPRYSSGSYVLGTDSTGVLNSSQMGILISTFPTRKLRCREMEQLSQCVTDSEPVVEPGLV